MPGLLGTLDLGSRSLQTQQQGVELAGHNIANANNPAYTRQRLRIETMPAVQTGSGLQGTGANAVAIVQLRSALLDRQIQAETSVSGYLDARQSALQLAQNALGQDIITRTDSASASGAAAVGLSGLAAGLSDLFSAFQSLSTDPSSQSQRTVVLMKAADLATRFNQTDQRLAGLQDQLNDSLATDTAQANDLLSRIAGLNAQITDAEAGGQGAANDLRDLRQEKIEQLTKLANVSVADESNGAVTISLGGTTFVSGRNVLDSLETYDAGGGQMLLRAQQAGTPVALTGGSLAATIDTRDGDLAGLRQSLNSLASSLITEVNNVHRAGFNLNGGTGADFFTGTGAADIQVNRALLDNPALLQASGTGAAGDNQTALALAQLAGQPIGALNGQTFSQSYSQTVTTLAQSLASTNTSLDDQSRVQTMLNNQRSSISGVSLDEEMTDMMKYQKAFEASARLVSVVDQMLSSVLNMAQ